ncbi:uncharacterized protein E5676_scaffold236G00720 [Cucumis melo var. makuwa]|uniref:Uncharacterized protein n=1 Tax=Cucumis melo var. makuwa TaxID=1194695 RepID=A0A5A7T2Y1_CUCMM|nr:uncharacterized protein E6C27_scaffold113G00050 [Cucumis melo var. makuwa]TYK27203.1 uncharacterized protein E5676_scaffold236G00720 [Cucumis melo var. makuwa]
MIFCAADEPSLSFVRETLQKFGELLNLLANLGKSSIFVVGGSNEVASRMAASMGFVLGNLPVRYLGLPLLTGRLHPNDCAPLIQRITSRIRSWTVRVLSYVGRLQLVRFVLRSLQVYCASVFVLSACVHNKVDKILMSYLWRGKEEGRGGVKMAWAEYFEDFLVAVDEFGFSWMAWVEAYIVKGTSLWAVDNGIDLSPGYWEGCEEEVVARSLMCNYLLYLEGAESSSPQWLGS